MGTGKSSVGRRLAHRLSLRFVDTDKVIEKQEGQAISNIFKNHGEGYFREIEKEALKRICKDEGLVIATGGGAVVDPKNLKVMKNSGAVVCLTASPEVIYNRVKRVNTRPLLLKNGKLDVIKKLLKKREPFYNRADLVIDTSDKGIDEVADAIMDSLNLFNNSGKTSTRVELGDRSYPILYQSDQFEKIGYILKRHGLYKKVALITNPTVRGLYGRQVTQSLKNAGFEPSLIEIPDGERFKSLKWVSKIYDELLKAHMDRNSSLIAMGGGVIGDITGFVAATFLRGVPFVQLPTTLLAQVDSSVGGKTGVNHPLGKNLIGAFYQPKIVIIDTGFLNTLKLRELKAGLAEVIKYGVIRDERLFSYLEDNIEAILSLKKGPLIRIIKRSCEIKAGVVEDDEREDGIRAILNFGHTFGHAIETNTGYRRFRHGEAVALGMILASRFSNAIGLCKGNVEERIKGLLIKTGLPSDTSSFAAEDIIRVVEFDKKVIKEHLRLVLVRKLGDVILREFKLEDFSLDLGKILK